MIVGGIGNEALLGYSSNGHLKALVNTLDILLGFPQNSINTTL